ncbi:c-type cytochrome [Roseovarius sp.]|uniref:c-type cytochrome n=1 Tax=Roseovarius sp. TaxID=1486281 RepID=UPI003A96C124
MRRKCIGMVIFLAGQWAGMTMAGAVGPLPYRDGDAVARGAQIYARTCAACHGAALQGEADWQTRDADGYLPAPPHDESGHTWHHPDRILLDIVRRGTAAVVGQGYESRMPGYAGVLTEAEMREVLAYIKSTWPARVIQLHDRINAEAGG